MNGRRTPDTLNFSTSAAKQRRSLVYKLAVKWREKMALFFISSGCGIETCLFDSHSVYTFLHKATQEEWDEHIM